MTITPAPLATQRGQQRLGDLHQPDHVDLVHRAASRRRRRGRPGGAEGAAGVVDEHVERWRRPPRRARRPTRREVTSQRTARAADLAGERLDPVAPAGGAEHVEPLRGEAAGGGGPDPAAGSGHDGGLGGAWTRFCRGGVRPAARLATPAGQDGARHGTLGSMDVAARDGRRRSPAAAWSGRRVRPGSTWGHDAERRSSSTCSGCWRLLRRPGRGRATAGRERPVCCARSSRWPPRCSSTASGPRSSTPFDGHRCSPSCSAGCVVLPWPPPCVRGREPRRPRAGRTAGRARALRSDAE